MSRSARWNSEHNRTQSQQSRPSKGGFWGLVDKAANSQLVTSINRTGDAVRDMLDPVKQFKTAMTHSGEAIESFRSGQIIRGAGYTALTVVDSAGLFPLGKAAAGGIQFTTRTAKNVLSRWGVFGRSSVVEGAVSNKVINSSKFIGPRQVVRGTDLKPYSMTNEEVRVWYHSELDLIPSRINPSLSLKEKSLEAFRLRNEIKLQARDLMANRRKALELPPPKNLKDVTMNAYSRDHLVGDDFWNYILTGSRRSNAMVDEAIGLTRTYHNEVRP